MLHLWQNPGFVILRMQSHGGKTEVSAAIAQPGGETAMLPHGTKAIVLGNPVRCQNVAGWSVTHFSPSCPQTAFCRQGTPGE